MSNHRPIDGRYFNKKELETRLLTMGVDFFVHLLECKGDFVDVYNKYVHIPYYARRIKSQLKNDAEELELNTLAGYPLTGKKRRRSGSFEETTNKKSSNRKNTNITAYTTRTMTSQKKIQNNKNTTAKKRKATKSNVKKENNTNLLETKKKSTNRDSKGKYTLDGSFEKNIRNSLNRDSRGKYISESSVEIDLIGDGAYYKDKSNSNVNNSNITNNTTGNKSLSKNTYKTKISTNSKHNDSAHKKIYEVLFPGKNDSVNNNNLPNNLNNLKLNESKSKPKIENNKKDENYNLVVNRLKRITRVTRNTSQDIREIEKKEKPAITRKVPNFVKNLADQSKKQINNIQAQTSSNKKKQSTTKKDYANSNSKNYNNTNDMNAIMDTNFSNLQHINVICNVNNSKSGQDFTLGKKRIPKNMFTSSSTKKKDMPPVKSLNYNNNSENKESSGIKVTKLVKASDKNIVMNSDNKLNKKLSNTNNNINSNNKYNTDNYLTYNQELYNKLGLKDLKMKEEEPFKNNNINPTNIKKDPSGLKSKYSHSPDNIHNNYRSSQRVFDIENENKDTTAYNVGDDNSSSIDSSVFKIQKIDNRESIKQNFLFRDFTRIPGINIAYLLKLGVAFSVIAATCYYCANSELREQASALFSFLLEKYLGITEINIDNKVLIAIIVIFALYELFVLATLRHIKIKRARDNYNTLVEISSEEEFPNEQDFLISESNIIKKFASQNDMTVSVYEYDIYPLLKYFIEEEKYFYYEIIDGEMYLKIVSGARSGNQNSNLYFDEEDSKNNYDAGELEEHEEQEEQEESKISDDIEMRGN